MSTWIEEYIKKISPQTTVGTAGLGPNLVGYSNSYSGLDDTTIADINDADFGIAAQMNYAGDGVVGDLGIETPGAMDWLNSNSKGLGTGIQAIGLGASLYDTFFGDSAKINDKNMKLMDQQIASNADTIANTKAVRAAWADTEAKVS